MALDKEYFDSINIDVVKKKYYNANKVNALLADIQTQAEKLEAENASLKEQLCQNYHQKSEIGDTLLTAQAAAKDIISRANTKAAGIIAEAEAKVAEAEEERSRIFDDIAKQQDYAAACVEQTFARLKRQQLENVEMINGMWQEFLCGLLTEEPKTSKIPDSATCPRLDQLESKVKRIADELSEINSED